MGYEHNRDIQRSNNNKYTLNLRQSIDLAPWLNIDLTTNLSLQKTNTAIQPYHTGTTTFFPYEMLADANGEPLDHTHLVWYEGYHKQIEEQSLLDLNYVPLLDMKEGFDKTKSIHGRINLGITAKLAKGLRYEGRFQYQQSYSKQEQFYSQFSSRVREELVRFTVAAKAPATVPTYYLPQTGGQYTVKNNDGMNWTVRNQLSYDHVFGQGGSQITAIAGMEIQSGIISSNGNTRRGYDPQSMTYIPINEESLRNTGVSGAVLRGVTISDAINKLGLPAYSQGETETRFVSFYANAAYTFMRNYSLNGSVRVDQSNLYGSDNSVQFKPVWSLGVAWNMKNEAFLASADFLNRLNMRFSYGLGGNSPTPGQGGPYNMLESVRHSQFAGMGLGYRILYPANDKICWERTRTINLGVDFAVLDNRISGSIDAYHKLTTELLSTIPSDQTLGWDEHYSNYGDMKNQGFEMILTSRNIVTPAFRWTTTLTVTNNYNKVLKLHQQGSLTASRKITFKYIEGYAGNSLFAYRWAGLNSEGNPQVYNSLGELTTDPNDPDMTAEAVKFMGVTQPKWYGAMTNSFSYKGFDLSFMLVYNLGHKMRRNTNNLWYGRMKENPSAQFLDRWQKEGDEEFTNVPKYVPTLSQNQNAGRNIPYYTNSDLNVVSASYVKLRDVTLSYSLPRKICDKISAEKVTLRAQASNLFLIAANDDGIDPEYHNYRSGYLGTKYGPSWSFGLTINFK